MGRIKEAKGLAKQLFNSHIDNLFVHEMYIYWDEVIVTTYHELHAFDEKGNVVYMYRVTVEEDGS